MKLETRELQNRSGNRYTVYDMSTGQGLTVSVLTLGAAIQRVVLRDDQGSETDLALGFEQAEPYETALCYAGATLAPNAGRIKQAELPIGNKICHLTENDGSHQLHGGPHNLSLAVWKTETVTCDIDSAGITLSAVQADGVDGYPGNRTYQTTYTLEDTNWLTIRMTATTDRPTYVNMSNHTYWHLGAAGSRSALDHELLIAAGNVCVNDRMHLPADLIPVGQTAFDFRSFRRPEAAMQSAADPVSIGQLELSRGYNHAYLLNQHTPFRKLRSVNHLQALKSACVLKDDMTGHMVKMFTDAPALVLYTGGFLPDEEQLCGSRHLAPGCAIALEAQDLPDVMHFLPEAYHLTTPDRPFCRTIRYHIS